MPSGRSNISENPDKKLKDEERGIKKALVTMGDELKKVVANIKGTIYQQ